MSDRLDDTDGPGRQPSLADRALDLLVFAPAGAVLSALEDVPSMAARGRAAIEQEVRNAHLIGRFAVNQGQRRLRQGIERLGSAASGAAADQTTHAGPPPAEGEPAPPATAPPAEPTVVPIRPEPAGETGPADEEAGGGADLAIPGYDTLSASQVVRRLDGLGPQELAAVFRHESATRGRRTILHRTQQLLGQTDQRPPAGT